MSVHLEGLARVILKTEVFLNPAQVFNRDTSILAVSTFAKLLKAEFAQKGKDFSGISILEALAATGIRSIRYAKEIGCPITRHVANDWS